MRNKCRSSRTSQYDTNGFANLKNISLFKSEIHAFENKLFNLRLLLVFCVFSCIADFFTPRMESLRMLLFSLVFIRNIKRRYLLNPIKWLLKKNNLLWIGPTPVYHEAEITVK